MLNRWLLIVTFIYFQKDFLVFLIFDILIQIGSNLCKIESRGSIETACVKQVSTLSRFHKYNYHCKKFVHIAATVLWTFISFVSHNIGIFPSQYKIADLHQLVGHICQHQSVCLCEHNNSKQVFHILLIYLKWESVSVWE